MSSAAAAFTSWRSVAGSFGCQWHHIPRLASCASVVVASLLGWPLSAGHAATLRLIPRPSHVALGTGYFPLQGEISIAAPGGSADELFAAGLLRDEIESTCPATVYVTKTEKGDIVLAQDTATTPASMEGYRIVARPSGVRVTSRSSVGLFWGVQTLRQMVDSTGIPSATITDSPALGWRGIQDDVSRGPVPTLETLKRRIRIASDFKMNAYVLYLETAFAYHAHPLLAPEGGALTEPEVRDLVAYASRFHITLVPEQQTMGHLANVLKFERYSSLAEVPHGSTLVPGPAAVAFVRSMDDELAKLFPGPFLHLGGDEISEIGRGESHDRVESTGLGVVYIQHLCALAASVRAAGKRPIFWGDVCVDRPELVHELPSDMVVASWCYDVKPDYGRWISPFRQAKLDLIVCPGTANWNRVFPNLDIALPNIRGFIRQGIQAGALGALICTWSDNGDAPFDLNWYPIAAGAAASWQGTTLDTSDFRLAFDWAMFRNRGTGVSDAIWMTQRGHRVVQAACGHDANLALYWQNPFVSPLDRQLLLVLQPTAADLCKSGEQAIECLRRARAVSRRNADVLDQLEFAARRIDAIGMRARVAKRVPELYQQFVGAVSPGGSTEDARHALDQINALLVEGRDTEVSLRFDHEQLWLHDNRPYWLGNIMASYDRDIQIWVEKLDTFRQVRLALQLGLRIPTPQEIGLAP